MPHFTYEHRVRYRECDPMGVVYHGHYVDFLEYARTEALRSLGVVYRELEESGIIMPVVDLGVKYHRPARYDDLLEIDVHLADEIPVSRVRIDYEIRRAGDDTRITTAFVTLCFVDNERGRPVRAPENVREAFARALGREDELAA